MRYQPTECILTEDELRKLCAEWQEVLRVADWDVKVRIVRGREIDDAGGRVYYRLSSRQASIRIRDHADWESDEWPQDMELALVHELVHLSAAPLEIEDEGPSHTAEEQHVDAMAQALVALKRAGQRDSLPLPQEPAAMPERAE